MRDDRAAEAVDQLQVDGNVELVAPSREVLVELAGHRVRALTRRQDAAG